MTKTTHGTVRGRTIELTEDKETSVQKTLGVRGKATNAQDGDRILVEFSDVTDPKRSVTVTVKADSSGRSSAAVRATKIPGHRSDPSGTFLAQASTLIADTVAEAESNIVTIVR